MSVIKFDGDGSVVEDTFTSESESSVATEAYVWNRILKDMAYSFKSKLSESDEELNEYIEFLKNMEINGQSLGALQAKATDFTTDDYLDATGLGSAISLGPANSSEVSIVNNGSLVSDLSESNEALMSDNDGLYVPLTPDGEEMPLLVASNERVKGIHNLEEAKEMWEKFLGHLTTETVETSDGEDEIDMTSDSDDEADHFMSEVNKVGPETAKNIVSYLVENREVVDWRNHIDAESGDWNDTIVTKDEAQSRLQQVAIDMDSDDFGKVSDMISRGDTNQAVTVISNYE